MGKTIKVFAFDDLDGEGTEAQHTDVPLSFGKVEVTIDLTTQHFDDLKAFLAPFLKVGTRAGQKNPQGKQRGRRPNQYYIDLRAWLADKHGIVLEQTAEGKYEYPDDLRRQYDKEREGSQ